MCMPANPTTVLFQSNERTRNLLYNHDGIARITKGLKMNLSSLFDKKLLCALLQVYLTSFLRFDDT